MKIVNNIRNIFPTFTFELSEPSHSSALIPLTFAAPVLASTLIPLLLLLFLIALLSLPFFLLFLSS